MKSIDTLTCVRPIPELIDRLSQKTYLNFRAKSEPNTATILLITEGIFSKRQNILPNAAIPKNTLQISLGSLEFSSFLFVSNRPNNRFTD